VSNGDQQQAVGVADTDASRDIYYDRPTTNE
jgi:hypothetical protein